MFAASTAPTRRSILAASAVPAVFGLALLAPGFGQALQAQYPVSTPVAKPAARPENAPSAKQPPAKIIVDPPKPEPLAQGVAIIQFRTENLQIVPVFGPAAAAVS